MRSVLSTMLVVMPTKPTGPERVIPPIPESNIKRSNVTLITLLSVTLTAPSTGSTEVTTGPFDV